MRYCIIDGEGNVAEKRAYQLGAVVVDGRGACKATFTGFARDEMERQYQWAVNHPDKLCYDPAMLYRNYATYKATTPEHIYSTKEDLCKALVAWLDGQGITEVWAYNKAADRGFLIGGVGEEVVKRFTFRCILKQFNDYFNPTQKTIEEEGGNTTYWKWCEKRGLITGHQGRAKRGNYKADTVWRYICNTRHTRYTPELHDALEDCKLEAKILLWELKKME